MMLRKSLGRLVLPVLAAVVLVAFAAADARAATLTELLQEGGIPFTYNEESGEYRIMVEVGGGSAIVVAGGIRSMKDELGAVVPGSEMAYLYTPIVLNDVPRDAPAQALKQMALFNDQTPLGNLSLTSDGNVFCNSSFWLRTADARMLKDHLDIMAYIVAMVGPVLRGYWE